MKTKEHHIIIDSPLGHLMLCEAEGALTHCNWSQKSLECNLKTDILLETERQLLQYFSGQRQSFELPLAPQGTPFQKSVWQALRAIPFGSTHSYQDIARTIGNEKAVRAVGLANSKNPISIIIPCHRVIRASGYLGGYAGGLECKKFLLALEASHTQSE